MFLQENIQMATGKGKDAQYYLLLEKRTSKLLWGITFHQSERPSSERLQTNAGGAVEQSEPSHTAGGNAGAATVAKSTAVPQNLERELPYDPATSLQDKHAEESENSNSKIRGAPQYS